LGLLSPEQTGIGGVDGLSKAIIKEGAVSKGGVAAVIEPLNDHFKASAGEKGMHAEFNMMGGGTRLGRGLLVDVVIYKREVRFLPGALTMVKKGEMRQDPQTRRLIQTEDRTLNFTFGKNASVSFDEKSGKIALNNIKQK
jgi:hypothetical protein